MLLPLSQQCSRRNMEPCISDAHHLTVGCVTRTPLAGGRRAQGVSVRAPVTSSSVFLFELKTSCVTSWRKITSLNQQSLLVRVALLARLCFHTHRGFFFSPSRTFRATMVTHRSSLSPSPAVFQSPCHAEPLSRAEGICSERHDCRPPRRPPPPPPPLPSLPPSSAMELKVWVDGVVRVVCGLSEETSCQDVVIALAQAIGECNCAELSAL